MQNLRKLSDRLNSLSPVDGLNLLAQEYKSKIVFSTSFGLEDQVITHLIAKDNIDINVFTLDTGRLFQETYEVMDRTRSKYKLDINVYYPNTQDVEKLTREKGFNSFYESVENRKECCFVRKVVPLRRALDGNQVWVTGLRAEQSDNRQDMPIVEWDDNFKIIKYNPIINWSQEDVDNYIEENKVPINSLKRQGFISIGCSPCTRAISEGEHPRAGRWWWETSQKECGLHSNHKDLSLVK